jgi:hypothetical protein
MQDFIKGRVCQSIRIGPITSSKSWAGEYTSERQDLLQMIEAEADKCQAESEKPWELEAKNQGYSTGSRSFGVSTSKTTTVRADGTRTTRATTVTTDGTSTTTETVRIVTTTSSGQ